MNFIRLFLLFAPLCLGVAHAEVVTTKNAAVFVYYYEPGDDSPAHPDHLFRRFRRALQNDATVDEVHLIKAKDAASLERALRDLPLEPSTRITRLIFSSHGSSGAQAGDVEEPAGKTMPGTRVVHVALGSLEFFGRVRANADEFEFFRSPNYEMFAPLRAHMSDQAEVMLVACKLVSGNAIDAALKATLLARVFGVRDGQIYANRTASHCDKAFYRMFWQLDGRRSKVTVTSVQTAVAAISIVGFTYDPLGLALLPAVMAVDFSKTIVFNRGYTFTIRDSRVAEVTKETSVGFSNVFFRRPCASLLDYARPHVGW